MLVVCWSLRRRPTLVEWRAGLREEGSIHWVQMERDRTYPMLICFGSPGAGSHLEGLLPARQALRQRGIEVQKVELPLWRP